MCLTISHPIHLALKAVDLRLDFTCHVLPSTKLRVHGGTMGQSLRFELTLPFARGDKHHD